MTGIAVDLVKIVADKLGFSVTLLPSTEWISVDLRTMTAYGSVADVSAIVPNFTT